MSRLHNWKYEAVMITDSSFARELDPPRTDPAVMLLIDGEASRTHAFTPDDAERIGIELIVAAHRAREAQTHSHSPKGDGHD